MRGSFLFNIFYNYLLVFRVGSCIPYLIVFLPLTLRRAPVRCYARFSLIFFEQFASIGEIRGKVFLNSKLKIYGILPAISEPSLISISMD